MSQNIQLQTFLFSIVVNILLTNCYNLEKLLTKDDVRLWYQNQTNLDNIKNPYCAICCPDIRRLEKGRKCGIHTMCVYEPKPTGPACKGLIIMDFSDEEINAIVDAHNTLRNRVAMGWETQGDPGPQQAASNMRLITWDQELSHVVLRWATQCIYYHDRCRDLSRFPVGQNIAESNYASRSDLKHIENWYSKVEFYRNTDINSYKIYEKEYSSLSQYTQLVWADTYLVGCARVSFQKIEKSKTVYKEHFFCNYGPSGNIAGQPVYKPGEPCSACLEGTGCTDPEYPGLCGNEIVNETYYELLRRKSKLKLETNSGKVYKGVWVNVMFVCIKIKFISY
ncbi:venom allergen 3-like [Sitophilus oryzae]|uniref:Venom allergen 3-like n=1 Tax=Sitophilus oryzae TaxID=7048 RepID=A0A6J2XXU8_SITOR|nr:venom allergen 3-like [Sitophilus oryzae]